jgi:hypothetical protein
MIELWAEKELRNLIRMKNAGKKYFHSVKFWLLFVLFRILTYCLFVGFSLFVYCIFLLDLMN